MKKIRFTLSAIAIISLSSVTFAQNSPKLNPGNINEVLSAMTPAEKAALLVGYSPKGGGYAGLPVVTPEDNGNPVAGAAGMTFPLERFGIPLTVLADGPAGLRINPTRPGDVKTYYCTGFPVGTLLASTWNTALVEQVGDAIGNEVLEYGADVLLAPGMNIHRNPLCGRNFEYYSEDPVLTGKIAAAMVRGVQSNGVGTSVKHFAANNQETNRKGDDVIVSQRALREIYLKGFEIAVKEAQPWTVMSSYNKINGVFTQEDHVLLTSILRREWGFKGMVMTDWTAKRNTSAQVKAGNDLMMPGYRNQIEDITEKINSGELKMSEVDTCVKRILEYIVKTPRFKGYKYSNAPDLALHAKITRSSAVEGMVLLKNEGSVLPLKGGLENIALFGVTSYDFIAGGTGSGHVNKAYVVDLLDGLSNAGFGVNEQLGNLYKSYMTYQTNLYNVTPFSGFWASVGKVMIPEMPVERKVIEKIAQGSSVAIITIGRNSGEASDRKIEGDFDLSETERSLITNVCNVYHAAGKKVIVILNIGGVIETASWKMYPDAILLAWQAGQEGGNSVADVLKGIVNPSGKLPVTFPLSYMDHPSSANFPYDYAVNPAAGEVTSGGKKAVKNVDYTKYEEDIWIGYRYFATSGKAVSYPFGFGLSYTTFAYGDAKVKSLGEGKWEASVKVVNTGKVPGKEIVELYIAAPAGRLEKPARELKAFAKSRELNPGESQILTMTFTGYDLASYDQNKSAWITDPGSYNALFGASVEDIRLTTPFLVRLR
jgi:beta-glucosidase